MFQKTSLNDFIGEEEAKFMIQEYDNKIIYKQMSTEWWKKLSNKIN